MRSAHVASAPCAPSSWCSAGCTIPRIPSALARLLGSADVRHDVIEAIVRFGPSAVTLLVEQLASDDIDTQRSAVVGTRTHWRSPRRSSAASALLDERTRELWVPGDVGAGATRATARVRAATRPPRRSGRRRPAGRGRRAQFDRPSGDGIARLRDARRSESSATRVGGQDRRLLRLRRSARTACSIAVPTPMKRSARRHSSICRISTTRGRWRCRRPRSRTSRRARAPRRRRHLARCGSGADAPRTSRSRA